ncbi:MAG: hypothetical protein K940chlam8_01261 [Chlamydiae bacterium]|nr:hypothetical protein [Chlamydiota bacterium]
MPKNKGKNLGDYKLAFQKFSNLGALFRQFKQKSFLQLNLLERSKRISQVLLDQIVKTKTPCFLLYAVVEFIEKVRQEKIVEKYSMTYFEFWLNQFSKLSKKDQLLIRGKIVGKYLPREEYQVLFPIGMQKEYPGPHFVSAHASPDLDTIVASFWGWVDAFACKVGTGLHVWNIPGEVPTSIVELDFLFTQIFSKHFFKITAKTRTALAVTGVDLISQHNVISKKKTDSTIDVDHERHQNAVVMLDENGYFLGDWRTSDVEGMLQVITLLNSCLRAFENMLQVKLITLFARKQVTKKDLEQLIEQIFSFRIEEANPAREFTEKQKSYLSRYLQKVLKVKGGVHATFFVFAQSLKKVGAKEFLKVKDMLKAIADSKLFGKNKVIVENRPLIFRQVEMVIETLQKALLSIRKYFDSMKVAMEIKEKVFEHYPQYVTLRTDIEEIRSKMQNYQHLSVVKEHQNKPVHYGVIYAKDCLSDMLGTVSVRDFSNREEVGISSFLQIISVIDHHKSNLQTTIPTQTTIMDTQSANVLVAKKAMHLNTRYSLEGATSKDLLRQSKILEKKTTSIRIKKRLLDKLHILQNEKEHWVCPEREFLEYMHFIYAILDDTDLLTKVSFKDMEVVADILNRMKSIQEKKQVEIVHLDGIKKDEEFAKKAASRILQNQDVYSLYKKVYAKKEEAFEKNILQCVKNKPDNFFEDTKLLNKYAKVGQTKMFAKNIKLYLKYRETIQKIWYQTCKGYVEDHADVNVYLHMVSTIRSADDVFKGQMVKYQHQDELWIWIPDTEQAYVHLKRFLNAFKYSPGLVDNVLSLEFLGGNAKILVQLFKESFLKVPMKVNKNGLPIAVLRFRAGSMNSRKAMIAPFIPSLVS